jgi:hypothetical protein
LGFGFVSDFEFRISDFAMTLHLLIGLVFAGAGQSPDDSLESLAAAFKPLLAAAVPAVLYEKSTNWGHQELAADGLRWHGLRTEVKKAMMNDGQWSRVRVTSQELPRTLHINITDVRSIDAETQAFKVFLAFQVGVEYEQQNWNLGVRQWSGSIRARLQLKVALDCENVIRVEPVKNSFVPDLVFRLRVTKADVSYDNLVVEHINGVGGSAARLTGEAVRSALKQWKPSIERNLLARADAAILKAADTREVRIGLGGLVKKKS